MACMQHYSFHFRSNAHAGSCQRFSAQVGLRISAFLLSISAEMAAAAPTAASHSVPNACTTTKAFPAAASA